MDGYNPMVVSARPDRIATTADYRRQARRIRASFVGNSFLTQQAIGDLAKSRNRETRTNHFQAGDDITPVDIISVEASSACWHPLRNATDDARRSSLHLEISAVVERGFSEHATSKLQPFGFTYSDRMALLDAAEKLGISRFRGNLILAMLENQPARSLSAASLSAASLSAGSLSGGGSRPRAVRTVAASKPVPLSFLRMLMLMLGIEILAAGLIAWIVLR